MRTMLLVLVFLFTTGCLSGPENPSFPLTVREGRAALDDMRAAPRPPSRPLVIVGGYMGSHAPRLHRVFRERTGDERIIHVSVGSPESLDACREKIIAAVDAAFPSTDPQWTQEVDVIGVSLGGLAARYAAAPVTGRQLRIARLFTISSPHQGAVIAKNYVGRRQRLWRELRPGSDLLCRIAASDGVAAYTLYPYVRRHDAIVGDANAAPAGEPPIWVSARRFREGHDDVWKDARIIADIARHLRSEPAFSLVPRQPLPQ